MSLYTDRIQSMKRQSPEHIPVRVCILPSAWIKYRDDLHAVVSNYPELFEGNASKRNYDEVPHLHYRAGQSTDAWGCIWSNIQEGCDALVTGHPVLTREAVHSLQIPTEDMGFPHGFMFLRLADLRGFEEVMVDFAEEPPELQMLIDKVLTYNLSQARNSVARLNGRQEEIIFFGDDLGTQYALPISPARWRTYLKPCFTQIYEPFREAGHHIYMHTDGHIIEIIPDLIDAGVEIVNPQIRANGLDRLVDVCKGKICVDLDLDRQMFPFCRPDDIDPHFREAVEKLGSPEGGLWLTAEVDHGVPLANIEAICAAAVKYRRYYAKQKAA